MLSTAVVVFILVALNLWAFSLFHTKPSHAELKLVTKSRRPSS